MSDPVTNAEIEDVLSAVRRLVSGTPGTRRETPVAEDQGKLVLTPAFRVDPEKKDAKADEVVPEAPFTHADDAAENAESFAPRDNITSMVQEALTEGAETSDTADVTPDFDTVTGIEVTLSDDDAADIEVEGRDVAASLEARIAELESVVVEAPEQDLEPAEGDDGDRTAQVLFQHSARDETAPETPTETADDEPINESVMSEEAPRAPDLGAEDWQDVAEAPFEGYDEQYDDVDPVGEDVTLDASAYVRHEEEVAFAEEPTSEPADDDDDEMVIDEAMLREIVARLVREELQGTMGERITRNLRRMVRREIARALALKEFE